MLSPDCRHRILYVGRDLALLKSLSEALGDCRVLRCPGGAVAHDLIGGEVGYSLLLLDGELPGTTGPELARFARGVRRRESTPIIILSAGETECAGEGIFLGRLDDPEVLAGTIRRLLAAP